MVNDFIVRDVHGINTPDPDQSKSEFAMDKKRVTGEEEGVKDIFCLDGRCMTLKMRPIQQNLIEESTDGESESEAQNPLQNPLIFHHVLSYVNNLDDLKNCRLVHSTWTDEASIFLKKKSVINMNREFLKTSKQDMISLEEFHPQNLILLQEPCSFKNWGIVKEQITKLGNGVKSLKFHNTVVRLNSNYRRRFVECFTEILQCSNFQNLVHLTIRGSDLSWPDPPPPPINLLKQIHLITNYKPSEDYRPEQLKSLEGVFKLAPNLESLNLRTWVPDQWYCNNRRVRPPVGSNMILDHLNSHISSFSNLKDLSLDQLSPMDILALSNLKIKLRSLKLPLLPKRADYQKFHDFLKNQNGTLERFRLVFPTTPPNEVAPHFTFPCLPKLKKLKLVHNRNSFRMTFDDLDYAQTFPVLQSLVIKYSRRNDDFTKEPKDSIWSISPVYGAFLPLHADDLDRQVCRTLRVLKLPYPNQSQLMLEEDDLSGIRERLSIMFPNVQNEHLDIRSPRVAERHWYLASRPSGAESDPDLPSEPAPAVPEVPVILGRTRSRTLLLQNQN